MEINVKKSSMICPAVETPRQSLWVSNLDLITMRYHVPTVYFFKSNGSSDYFDSQVLKDALRKILVPFYPVAGRLQNGENGRLEIICNQEGVLFVEAQTSAVIDDLVGNYTDHSNVSKLVPIIDYSGGVSSYPLLALQVTRFRCGGVSLGVASQHTLMDGASALHFINSWADTARGLPLNIEPFLDRTLLRARLPPTPQFHHPEFDSSPSLKTTQQLNDSDVCVFKITLEQLNILKAKMKENRTHSSYCILTAHIWRCATKARGLEHDQAVKLIMPIDGRTRLYPTLPTGFFGNVIFWTTTDVSAGELQSEPFSDTVKRVYETVKKMNNEYLRSNIDYIENVDDINTLVRGAHTVRCPNLSINSWVRLPIHDADFGWGRPVFMRPANVVQEGKVFILPSPNNDESLSVVTRLETSRMKTFEKLLYEI